MAQSQTTIPFADIPGDHEVPLFYAEIDNSAAALGSESRRTLLVGPMLTTGTGNEAQLYQITNASKAKQLFGENSYLAMMAEVYLDPESHQFSDCWAMGLEDDGSAVKATAALTVTAKPTEDGTLYLELCGRRVAVPMLASYADTTATASAIASAFGSADPLPATAGAALAVVTFTAVQGGTLGNFLDLRVAPDTDVPAGLTFTIAEFSGGANDPDVDTAITAIGSEPFEYIVQPWADHATDGPLDKWESMMAGRWGFAAMLYGHVFTAFPGTQGELTTKGNARNDPHMTIAGYAGPRYVGSSPNGEYKGSPTPPWEYAASFAAQVARSANNDPGLPFHTLELAGVYPVPMGQRFELTELQLLQADGIATSTSQGSAGITTIMNGVTTYQTDANGNADESFKYMNTLFTAAFVTRFIKQRVESKYARMKLADDGTPVDSGAKVVTPSIIRGEMVTAYQELVALNIVENLEAFKKYLRVERDAGNPNRVNVLFPPDYINQLRVFALLHQFRLQYPRELAA